jgi:hypothetical protein
MRYIVVLGLVLAACTTTPPVATWTKLPDDTTEQCRGLCRGIGLDLSAVIVVRNSAGCVCEVHPGQAKASASGGVASAAGALIVSEEEEASRAANEHLPRETEHHAPPSPR